MLPFKYCFDFSWLIHRLRRKNKANHYIVIFSILWILLEFFLLHQMLRDRSSPRSDVTLWDYLWLIPGIFCFLSFILTFIKFKWNFYKIFFPCLGISFIRQVLFLLLIDLFYIVSLFIFLHVLNFHLRDLLFLDYINNIYVIYHFLSIQLLILSWQVYRFNVNPSRSDLR